MRVLEADYVGSFLDVSHCPADRPGIAFSGRSNVGKSSLLNRFVHRKSLARTSRTPGRTRALNYFAIENDRTQPFYLIDLPGYGYASGSKAERATFAQAARGLLADSGRLAGLLQLVDASVPWQESDLEMLEWLLGESLPFALVFTKTDRVLQGALARHRTELARRLPWRPDIPVLVTSARDNKGIVAVREWVVAALQRPAGISTSE
jgi:GTP-binding protein